MIETNNRMNTNIYGGLKIFLRLNIEKCDCNSLCRKTSLVGQKTNQKINKKVTFADSRTLKESQRNGLRQVVSMKTSLKVGVPS